jgi:hypothetical protein
MKTNFDLDLQSKVGFFISRDEAFIIPSLHAAHATDPPARMLSASGVIALTISPLKLSKDCQKRILAMKRTTAGGASERPLSCA